MIPALIMMCLASAPTQCQSQSVRVEAAACSLRAYRGQAPINGAWTDVVIRVRCGGAR